MKYNQLSYIAPNQKTALQELNQLGFPLSKEQTDKENFEIFIRKLQFQSHNSDYASSLLIADFETNLLDFFKSPQKLTKNIFELVSLQLLGFIPNVDFTDSQKLIKELNFPVTYQEGELIISLHHLLATRQKTGMTLIDHLVSQSLIPQDNDYHFFNGKSLATFSTHDTIREVVYVQVPFDSDDDGELDLVKVNIIRPRTTQSLPTIMTASPYHAGINDVANDKKLHQMEGQLNIKSEGSITVQTLPIKKHTYQDYTIPITEATEAFTHMSSYTLNDYFLARGFANIYVSGIGTAGSTGFMTSGDYLQIESFKAVIDWLNGRATAFSSHSRDQKVLATWANGRVTTTGKSYLGTMSTGLATTGVKGLEVIIAESAISSWYEYYRENGLICSPGGYPGEDLDVLTELTYSRNLLAGDYLKNNAHYQTLLNQQSQAIDRESGDYNQYWHNRNYLPHAENISAEVVYTHGLQDWNVKPRQVFNIFNALPKNLKKHLFLHHGEHVYMNNWQSIDFRESMNALLTQKLLKQENHFQLPEIIWQDNTTPQTWQTLHHFGSQTNKSFPLGEDTKIIDNHYNQEDFERYAKNFNLFKEDLFHGKANQIVVDIPIHDDIFINGQPNLYLKIKSSSPKALLSAQILDYGKKKRFSDIPRIIERMSIDNGRLFSEEDLKELPFQESLYRVINKGVINLQNRNGLLKIEPIPENDWLDLRMTLQPSIYRLKAGDTLRILLYTTDFEHTIRDNSNSIITIDLSQSHLELPIED